MILLRVLKHSRRNTELFTNLLSTIKTSVKEHKYCNNHYKKIQITYRKASDYFVNTIVKRNVKTNQQCRKRGNTERKKVRD